MFFYFKICNYVSKHFAQIYFIEDRIQSGWGKIEIINLIIIFVSFYWSCLPTRSPFIFMWSQYKKWDFLFSFLPLQFKLNKLGRETTNKNTIIQPDNLSASVKTKNTVSIEWSRETRIKSWAKKILLLVVFLFIFLPKKKMQLNYLFASKLKFFISSK